MRAIKALKDFMRQTAGEKMKTFITGSGILHAAAFLLSLPGNLSEYSKTIQKLEGHSITDAYKDAQAIAESPESHSYGQVSAALDYMRRIDNE